MSELQVEIGELKCPRCGKEELIRKGGVVNGGGVVVVVFKCFFSASFDEGLTDEEMQKRLDEFEKSGRMERAALSNLSL